MRTPRTPHWSETLRIMRYLKKCLGQGLFYSKKKAGENLDIQGHVDLDWTGSTLDQKSTSGYCISLGGDVVIWVVKAKCCG